MFSFLTWLVLMAPASHGQSEREEAIELAKRALGEKLDAEEREISVRQAESTTWPDTSLGCPQEGEFYAQVLTPGYRVLVVFEDKLYRVHVGKDRAVVCGEGSEADEAPDVEREAASPSPAIPTPSDPELAELVSQAKDDLAERLSVEPDQIDLIEVEEVVWSNASLGCPRPGMEYREDPRDGARIRLRFDERTYQYHSGEGRPPFLCEEPREPS